MTCNFLELPGGGTAIVCTRGGRALLCQEPDCGDDHVALCDFPLGRPAPRATCDRRLCERHRRRRGKLDYCPAHEKLIARAPAANEENLHQTPDARPREEITTMSIQQPYPYPNQPPAQPQPAPQPAAGPPPQYQPAPYVPPPAAAQPTAPQQYAPQAAGPPPQYQPAPYAAPQAPAPYAAPQAPAPYAPPPQQQPWAQPPAPQPYGYAAPSQQGYAPPPQQGYQQSQYQQPQQQAPRGPYVAPGAEVFDDYGDAQSSFGGNYVDCLSPNQAGLHVFRIKRLAYNRSVNPKHPQNTQFFVAEVETLQSNVHAIGSTRSWSVNMNKQPSKGNVKDFVYAVLQAMGYQKVQVDAWGTEPVADPRTGQPQVNPQTGKVLTKFAQMCAWLVSAENPAGRVGVVLHCEASQIITQAKTPFTKCQWSPVPGAAPAQPAQQ